MDSQINFFPPIYKKISASFEQEMNLLMDKKIEKIKDSKVAEPIDPNFDWLTFPQLSKTEQVKTIPKGLFESVPLKEVEQSPSHNCPLKKHGANHHKNWRCDRVKESQYCRSEIHTYNSGGIPGWRCNNCDFDLCINCIKIDKFLAMLCTRED